MTFSSLSRFSPRRVVAVAAPMLTASLFGVALASTTATYEYDALGRLIKVEVSDGTDIEYDLDAVGNREQKNVSQTSPNSPPIALNDSASASALFQSVWIYPVANDFDADSDPLSVTAITQPWNGTATIMNPTTIQVIARGTGTDTFTYTVSDGNGGTDVGSITFTVNGGGPF